MESKNKHEKTTPSIAVLGTGSDVGKSVIATALCRILVHKGVRVAPYKAQNMSNNSGVTPEGLEMGRAQIVQAEASRIPPHVDMNPILLKPTSDIGAQIVLLGTAQAESTAMEYHTRKNSLYAEACAALDRLRAKYDGIVMEGAGSCAEVNLAAHDIVNLKMAEYAAAPVVLVADIHRGGVFAQIIGTLECLPPQQRDRIAGFIVNRFRGDIALFEDGVRWIEQKTGRRVYGVLPWYTDISIESEDSVVIENPGKVTRSGRDIPAVAVIRIPHISNFTDFDPLCALQGLDLHFLERVQDLSQFKAIMLPGSKNTRWDLDWLKSTGWWEQIRSYEAGGGHLLGICGGYQMLGEYVHDPHGLEGKPGSTKGLGLLPVETVLKAPKTTTLARFSWQSDEGTGYEIHMGETNRTSGRPLFQVFERNRIACDHEDGCCSGDFRILGTYMHGLFDTPEITRRWLSSIGLENVAVSQIHGVLARDKEYDRLAEHFKRFVDADAIIETMGLG